MTRQRKRPLTQFDPDYTDPDEDDNSEPDEPDSSAVRRELRKSQKANKELGEQLASLESLRKENAFLKVGLPDTPVSQLYRDTYSGDLSEDAIKAGAINLGILQEVDDTTQAEINGIEGQSQALVGSLPSMAPDSEEAMWKEFTAVLQQGGNGEAVLRKYGRPVASDDR